MQELNKLHTQVSKPWGSEQWYELNDRYCFKKICLLKGKRCSLQYHKQKLETIYVLSGEAELEFAGEKVKVVAGDFWTTAPGVIHRLTALEDLVVLEASTPEVDDVIRVSDDTNRPDGRIEAEHGNVCKPEMVDVRLGNDQ